MEVSKPYQVFVGCPFRRDIRKNFDRLKLEIEKDTPLSVVLADTTAVNSTDYLLEHITTLIRESAGCIFDATGGNPNVSLEVGIAHALPANFVLTLYTRQARTREERPAEQILRHGGDLKPIIADLQGRVRIEYKTYNGMKKHVLERYLTKLPFMARWNEFRRRHASLAPHALRVFADLRTSGRSLRPRVDAILDGSGIPTTDLIEALTDAKLLLSKQGRSGGYYYPAR